MTQQMTGDPDFIPSARPAKYPATFEFAETSGPDYVEDDHFFTEWFNPTAQDVVLPIHIGTDPKNAMWRKAYLEASATKRQEMMTGNRIFIVRAGESKQIPSEFDLAIQQTHCLHPQCTAKRNACKDLDHPRVVSSGLAPQLICKRWHKVPSLAANLDTANALREAAMAELAKVNVAKQAAEMQAENVTKLLAEAQQAIRDANEARAKAEDIAARETRARLEAENKLQQHTAPSDAGKAKGK